MYSRYHHGQSRFRKYSLQEDPGWRKRSGSERDSGHGHSRRVSIQPEDATLQEVDIDDLMSHRSDDPRSFRRHKANKRGSFVHIGRKDGGEKLLQNVLSPQAFKKMYDHSPHAVSSVCLRCIICIPPFSMDYNFVWTNKEF